MRIIEYECIMAKVCCRLHHPLSYAPTAPFCHSHSHCLSISIYSTQHYILLSSLSSSSSSIHIICRSRNRWDSNAESYSTKNFNFNTSTDFNNDESAADDDEWDDVLQDYIDSIWILKVFGSYGWMLPFIIISLLLANGPKAFLLALALPLGQSTFTFAFQRMQQQDRSNKKTKKGKSRARSSRNAMKREEEAWVRSKGARKKTKGYRSRNRSASKFGGWDELDPDGEIELNAREFEKDMLRRRRDAPLLLRLLISIFPFFEFME